MSKAAQKSEREAAVPDPKYAISEVMQPGQPILVRQHGSFCCYCGDYARNNEAVEAMMTATGGCQRCVREGPHHDVGGGRRR